LVVDDEPDITSLFRKALERQGFSVDVYNDPTDSLKNFKPHYYDLIIIEQAWTVPRYRIRDIHMVIQVQQKKIRRIK
jgi:DNA-binding response OmpR family regulator